MPEELKFTTVSEKSRKYIFPSGEVEIKDVTGVCVRPSGTHRINAKDGKYIVQPGWIAIKLDIDNWTF